MIRTIVLLMVYLTCSIFQVSSKERLPSAKMELVKLDTIYIPTDLENALGELDRLIPDTSKNYLRALSEKEFSARMHLGFGTWLRNNWGLWAGSRLSKYFNDLEVFHPEEISGIILTSYYRRLVNIPINLEDQISYLKNYRKAVAEPAKTTYPLGVRRLKFQFQMNYHNDDYGSSVIHIAETKSGDLWLYDYNYGWARITSEDLQTFRNNPDNIEELIKSIFKRA